MVFTQILLETGFIYTFFILENESEKLNLKRIFLNCRCCLRSLSEAMSVIGIVKLVFIEMSNVLIEATRH